VDDTNAFDTASGPMVEKAQIFLLAERAQAAAMTRRLKRENAEVHWLDGLAKLCAVPSERKTREPFVLVDLELCEGDDAGTVAAIRKTFPAAIVVALAEGLDGERAARLLALGVPSLNKPVSTAALSALALHLADSVHKSARAETSSSDGRGRLELLLASYAARRGLSGQQRSILRLHLAGSNDKQIASTFACSEATVYEHWRRMARKAGGMHKGCVITDFHRFLDTA
jgi:DNA-binding NarL/FixJ family response regulator